MNSRQKEVVTILSKNPGFATAKEISITLNVNEKTIRADIDTINESINFIRIDSKRGRGYKIIVLNELEYYRFLKSIRSVDSVSVRNKEGLYDIYERVILLGFYQTVTYYELEEEFYMSLSQLRENIRIISYNLSLYDIKLFVVKDEVHIHGSTFNLMSCFSEYVYHRGNRKLKYLDSIEYRSRILKLIRDNGLFMSPNEFTNFLIHLDILLLFINEDINDKNEDFYSFKLHNEFEFLVAKDIASFLTKYLEVQLTKDDVLYIAIHLISKCSISSSTIEICSYDALESSYRDRVYESIRYISHNYGLDYSQDLYLHNSLGLYFYNLSIRNDLGTFKRSININDKKNIYTSYMLMSIDVIQAFYPKLTYQHLIHEASELAQHFYYSDLRNLTENNRNIALIVPEKNIGSEILAYQINRDFDKYFHKLDLVVEKKTKNLNTDNYSVIFSTVSNIVNKGKMTAAPIFITPFYSDRDIDIIQDQLIKNKPFYEEPLKSTKYTFATKDLAIKHIKNSLRKLEINLDVVNVENNITKSGVEFPEGYVLFGFPTKSATCMEIIELISPCVWYEYKVQTIYVLYSNVNKNFHRNLSAHKIIINQRFP